MPAEVGNVFVEIFCFCGFKKADRLVILQTEWYYKKAGRCCAFVQRCR